MDPIPREISQFAGATFDAGRDGAGIFRNIARDVSIPTVLSSGNYRKYAWYEICKILNAGDDLSHRLKV